MSKSKSLVRMLTLAVTLALVATLIPTVTFAAGGSTYYVSPQGSNAGAGKSTSAPWQTLEYAIGQMSDQDTLILMDGVYYEELNVNGKNNLTIRALNEGKAVITACAPVTGWTLDSANIWKAPLANTIDSDVYKGDGNIVFANGELCQEARWPDLTDVGNLSGSHPLLNLDNYARVEAGSSPDGIPTIIDSDLSELSALDLTDAYVWCPGGVAYWAMVSPVTAFDTASNTLTLSKSHFISEGYYPTIDKYGKKDGNLYYLFGSKALLSAQGEWYRGEDGLYMYSATEPQNVEFRVREYTMRVDSAEGINIEGISFRGGIPAFGENTSDCTLKACKVETIDYYMPRKARLFEDNTYKPRARGIILNGSNNTICGSELFNLYGEGVLLLGNDNRVVNNYIHDYNFEGNYSDGVQFKLGLEKHTALADWDNLSTVSTKSKVYGNRHLVSHNTFTHSGRSSIGGNFRKSVISYNDISDGCLLTRDGGLFYLSNFDYEDSEVHHNIFRDSQQGEGLQYGFYMDSLCAGLNVYRNVMYGLEWPDNDNSLAFVTSLHNIGNLFANNTIINKYRPAYRWSTTSDRSHTILANNIFYGGIATTGTFSDMDMSNNLYEPTNFTDEANGDYTLASTATGAIDCGMVIPGITDGSVGAPDIGAYEYGNDKWTAGHDFSKSSYSNEAYHFNTRIPYKNVVENGSFEYYNSTNTSNYNFDGWTSDSPLIPTSNNTWNEMSSKMYGKNGTSVLTLTPGTTATQTISGLKPNTAYEVGAYAMSMLNKHSTYIDDYAVVGSNARYQNSGSQYQGSIAGFTEGDTEDWFCYNFDFGTSGIDLFRFDIVVGRDAKSSQTRKIEFYDAGEYKVTSSNQLDVNGNPKTNGGFVAPISPSDDGVTLIASQSIDNKTSASGNTFTYDVKFANKLAGRRLIYLRFVGDFSGVRFGSSTRYYFFDSTSTDKITLTATSDSGETRFVDYEKIAQMPDKLEYVTITTGPKGTVKIDLTKSEGAMNGYVDEVRMRQAFTNEFTFDCTLSDYAVYNADGTKINSIRKSSAHTVKGTATDPFGTGGALTLVLTSKYKDGTVFEIAETTVNVAEDVDFEITVNTPFDEGCYLELEFKAGENTLYTISDFTLSEQYDGTDVILDDFSVYINDDGVGKRVPAIAKGEFNMFEVALRNMGKTDVPVSGILAIYDDLKLIDILSIETDIDADDADRFWLGKVLPDSDTLSVKLFTWDNLNNLKPVVEHKVFN